MGYGIVEWIECTLRHPDLPGNPFIVLTPEQTDFFVRSYRIHPRTGRRIVRRATHQTSKGTGKAFESAGAAFATLGGPVVFDGWDEHGQPIGVSQPNAQVYVIAPSEEGTANIYSQIIGIGEVSPELTRDYGIKVGLTGARGRGSAVIKTVGVSVGAREGAITHLLLVDESQHWTMNRHHTVYETMTQNATKTNGLTICTTNAYRIGENSVAEQEEEAAEETEGLLYVRDGPDPDSVDYDVKDPSNVDRLRADLRKAYGGSLKENGGWLDLERLVEDILEDPKMTANRAKRFFLNVSTVGEHGLADKSRWDAAADDSLDLEPGSTICMGFDGSRTTDTTALVAITSDLELHLVKSWTRPPDLDESQEWEVDIEEVHAVCEDMFENFKVLRFYADPPYFREMLASLAKRFGSDKVVEFWTATQNRHYHRAIELFGESVRDGKMTHHDSPLMTEHVGNAYAVIQGNKYKRLVKRRQDDHIDIAVAAVLARFALYSWQLDNADRRKSKSRVLGVL